MRITFTDCTEALQQGAAKQQAINDSASFQPKFQIGDRVTKVPEGGIFIVQSITFAPGYCPHWRIYCTAEDWETAKGVKGWRGWERWFAPVPNNQ